MRCKLNLQFDEWPTHQNPKKNFNFFSENCAILETILWILLYSENCK